ncbi:hypothetical protein QV06_07560 [Gallibacterium genomosp. 3]|uniref:Uncharacterized protein n=1 Tax=Gallibacterium genomosp. 3 TaxID=505345 RepID=A0A1A7PQ73_9PAST|nr:hypothetical protein [Gallibacterium genomosp. 3]OBX04209.1 hypothetical protein QV06_07560 [Gallibacterium genomosp. 3]
MIKKFIKDLFYLSFLLSVSLFVSANDLKEDKKEIILDLEHKFNFLHDKQNGFIKYVPNINYFYNKKYDVGLKRKLSITQLVKIMIENKNINSYEEEDKLAYIFKILEIKTDSDFDYYRLLKDKDKYIALYQQVVDKAKVYLDEISTIPISYQKIMPFNISKYNYSFDEENLYIDDEAFYFDIGDLNIGSNTSSDYGKLELSVSKLSDSLPCLNNRRNNCHYIHIPIDIAEKLYNLNKEQGFTVLLKLKLKYLGEPELDYSSSKLLLPVELQDADIIFIDNTSNYIKLINAIRYNYQLAYKEIEEEKGIFDKKIIYQTKIVFSNGEDDVDIGDVEESGDDNGI